MEVRLVASLRIQALVIVLTATRKYDKGFKAFILLMKCSGMGSPGGWSPASYASTAGI